MAVLVQRAHHHHHNNMNVGQCQLTRSLERILEEAHFSGELKLSNRKLKDFPKTAATKYNLSDTVLADLSRNRFCELPEDITSFAFLETLVLYHNTIRSVSNSVKGLSSLTYLDLRSNHLTSLPRELCFLPIQVLLVANNRLTALPDELGRMEKLTDLDASCNQLSSLPMRIGDLRNLRSLSLRSNQLVYLPREITYLMLVSLNLSCNKITSLPVEMRQMSTLVDLNLENNPLTSPPASLCVRGLVHVFKYLDIQAMKEDKGKSGTGYDGLTTLRRTPRHTNSLTDTAKVKRTNVDSGYSTSDGIDKRWSQDAIRTAPGKMTSPKAKPSKLLDSTSILTTNQSYKNDGSNDFNLDSGEKLNNVAISPNTGGSSNSESTSPEDECTSETQKSYERQKNLGNIQTYREYKEALKQQRNQDISVYRSKGKNLDGNSDTNNDGFDDHANSNSSSHGVQSNGNEVKKGDSPDDSVPIVPIKRPVQKVTPSRSQMPLYQGGSDMKTSPESIDSSGGGGGYVKPCSPTKYNGTVGTNHVPTGSKLPTTPKISNVKSSLTKTRNVTWNSDIPAEKLSFTMRREFDRQKEETELLTQLRKIIETRLKMSMPDDIASALTDGVVLCHLANYVRPRSVGSIHVPSPGVPKLTMARCRRNVDNFLEACRRIGVDEESICSCEDVLNAASTAVASNELNNLIAISKTVTALFEIHQRSKQEKRQLNQDESKSATNTNSRTLTMNCMTMVNDTTDRNDFTRTALVDLPKFSASYAEEDSHHVDSNVFYTQSSGHFENGQDIERNVYLYNKNTKEMGFRLNNIEEEEAEFEEYCSERDRCAINGFDNANYLNYNGSGGGSTNKDFPEMNNLNRLNVYNQMERELTVERGNINMNVNNIGNIPQKVVTKRIEFFEETVHIADGGITGKYRKNSTQSNKFNENFISHNSTVLSIILSCTFIVTFLLLIFFPLPN